MKNFMPLKAEKFKSLSDEEIEYDILTGLYLDSQNLIP